MKKSRIDNSVMCGKSDRICITLKEDLFGCFRIEEKMDNDNETSLKKGGGIKMSTTVLHSRCSLSSLEYLPLLVLRRF